MRWFLLSMCLWNCFSFASARVFESRPTTVEEPGESFFGFRVGRDIQVICNLRTRELSLRDNTRMLLQRGRILECPTDSLAKQVFEEGAPRQTMTVVRMEWGGQQHLVLIWFHGTYAYLPIEATFPPLKQVMVGHSYLDLPNIGTYKVVSLKIGDFVGTYVGQPGDTFFEENRVRLPSIFRRISDRFFTTNDLHHTLRLEKGARDRLYFTDGRFNQVKDLFIDTFTTFTCAEEMTSAPTHP